MIHFSDDFIRIDGIHGNYKINCISVYNFCKDFNIEPETINFSNIKTDLSTVDVSNDRYKISDVKYPKLCVKNNSGYVLIDGKHRVHKEINMGKSSGLFYVLSPEQISNFIIT